jgi:hypothetical protein
MLVFDNVDDVVVGCEVMELVLGRDSIPFLQSLFDAWLQFLHSVFAVVLPIEPTVQK